MALVAGGVVAALLAACSRPTPPGTLVFVSNEGSSDVSVVDAYGYRELERIPMPAPPRGLAVSTDGRRIYVALRDDRIAVVDVATRRVVARQDAGDAARREELDSILLANEPVGRAQSFDNRLRFIANAASNDVSVIDVRTRREITRIKVGDRPWGVAVVQTK